MQSRKKVIESSVTAIEITNLVTGELSSDMVALLEKLREDNSYNRKRRSFRNKLYEMLVDGVEATQMLLLEDHELDEAKARATDLFTPFFEAMKHAMAQSESSVDATESSKGRRNVSRVNKYLTGDDNE